MINLKHGFTLIEVLVAVTIISIISTIGAVSYMSANAHARDGKRKSDLEQIRAALEIYKSDSTGGTYPSSSCNSGSACWSTFLTGYISSMPQDPKYPCGIGEVCIYSYCTVSGATYKLGAKLETSSGSSTCGTATNYMVSSP